MMRGIFITGTGTGVGKTWVTRGLARALSRAGSRVTAIKPVETGCDPDPQDAIALARACARPELAHALGLHRGRAPLAPWAATLEGEPALDFHRVAQSTRALCQDAELALVEGAGGLLVPLDADHDAADLALAVGAELLIVAEDRLGVLSHVLTAAEAARARNLNVRAFVLTRVQPDPSQRTNARILTERLSSPIAIFPPAPDEDDALADAAADVLRALGLRT